MQKPLLVCLILTLFACAEPAEKSPPNNTANNANNLNNSSGVTLIMRNDTDTTAYINDPCASDWFQIRGEDSNVIAVKKDCAFCECGDDSCGVCGQCRAMPPSELAPGDSVEWTWDGTYWTETPDQCLEQQSFSSGQFTADFCYGWTAGPSSFLDGGCYFETFELGVDATVTHSITDVPDPVDPLCAGADSNGFFPNCDLCGDDCDTIDAPAVSGNACGCSNGCPCGLRCGSYEIGPNIFVDNICVR